MLQSIDASWKTVFSEEDIPFRDFDSAEKWEEAGFTPAREDVFKVFRLPLHKVKLVVLGQDPYPQEGVATGRSFEVGGLEKWSMPIRQTSLRNILVQYCRYKDEAVKTLAEARAYAEAHPGKILSPPEFWEATEKKNVMWLNVALTTEVGKAGEHLNDWKALSDKVLRALNKEEQVRFLAWGKHAVEILESAGVGEKKILADPHPRVWTAGHAPKHLDELFSVL